MHKNRYGLFILLFVVVNPLAAEENQVEESGVLKIATCQFPVEADISANAEWIRKQMRQAHEQGVQVVHFSECALSGYARREHKNLVNFNWQLLRKETETIMALAKELKVWVVLGSTHQRAGQTKPHNSLYLINPEGKIIDRYDKRFCTYGDLHHYSPGDHFVTFKVNGITCGLLICFDVAFPEVYRQYKLLGVQVMFHSFYNARKKPDAVHLTIMPVVAQARAASNHMYISMNNSTCAHAWPSHFIHPDGLVADKLETHKPGIMINTVDLSRRYRDGSKQFRRQAILGKLNSGTVVKGPRSEDRTCY